tara:strand:- start:107 stop:526 length:420 start_codon:yes stop_codon:yes gene_type:complete
MPQNEDLYTIQDRSKKNEDNIRALDVSLNALADKTQQDIDDLDNAIDNDNQARDRDIRELERKVLLLESFINNKIANDMGYGSNAIEDYMNHIIVNPPPSYAGSVASDDSFTGGRRIKRKGTRKKKRRKSKRKSKRKYK